VVNLVLLLQTAQDSDRLLGGRLLDQHRLEPPLERRILLDVLPVLVDGRRPDAVQITARERRFENVRGVHRPLGSTGTDEGMHLVDEQQDLALFLGHFLDDLLDTVLELAAVLGAGEQGAQIEGEQPLALQALGDVTFDQTAGETLDHGSLAHTRRTDQHRVVLGPAAENLDHPPDLFVAADDRVDLAGSRLGHEIARVFIERGLLIAHTALVVALVSLIRAGHFQRAGYFLRRDLEGLQQTTGAALVRRQRE
jgi:hypothetical protein